MITAKCNRCGGSATADSFKKAKLQINHAIGLSRNIPCGDDRNFVVEVKSNNDGLTRTIPPNTGGPKKMPTPKPRIPSLEEPRTKKQKTKE